MVQNDSQIAVLYFCDQCFLFNSEPQESSRIHAESHECWKVETSWTPSAEYDDRVVQQETSEILGT